MSTKQASTKKRVLLSIAYWIIIILIGYLLMQTNLGTGNGNGKGGSGGGPATGMSSSGDGDGGGETDRNTTGYSGDESEPTGAENGQDDENSQDAQKPLEEEEKSLPVGEPESKVPSPVQQQAKPQTITLEKPIPKLSAQPPTGEKNEDPQGDFYKVVTGSEAKKGFFGIEVDGREKAFFILDVSSSMGTPTAEGLSRIQLMKNIFSAEIDRLHSSVQTERLETKRGRFIFASFSDNVEIFPQKGYYRYDLNKDVNNAKKHVNKLNTQGGTCMLGAFRRLKDKILELQTDTIYLLTDGESQDCSDEEMLEWLKKNLPKQKISTFSLGTQSQLLRDIAKQHHGKYREIR